MVRLAADVVLVGGTVIDGTGAPVAEDMRIDIQNGKILNVLSYEGSNLVRAEDLVDHESTLKDIATAIKKIADAMPPLRNR